jgi:Cytochrome P450
MVCYPEVQKKAQGELDKVLNGRLPEHSDFPSLPYISALVKEIYRYAAVCFKCSLLPLNCVSRWKPVLPLGRPLFVSNIERSCSDILCLVKAARISRQAMISTMATISPLTLL